MTEQTLVLIKPDAMERDLSDEIIETYKENGLKIKKSRTLHANEETAKQHYFELKDKPFFHEVIDYITRSPLMALILEGEDAISRVRELNGATNPNKAKEGTIRYLYGRDGEVGENCVHASDSPESAQREINIWFK